MQSVSRSGEPQPAISTTDSDTDSDPIFACVVLLESSPHDTPACLAALETLRNEAGGHREAIDLLGRFAARPGKRRVRNEAIRTLAHIAQGDRTALRLLCGLAENRRLPAQLRLTAIECLMDWWLGNKYIGHCYLGHILKSYEDATLVQLAGDALREYIDQCEAIIAQFIRIVSAPGDSIQVRSAIIGHLCSHLRAYRMTLEEFEPLFSNLLLLMENGSDNEWLRTQLLFLLEKIATDDVRMRQTLRRVADDTETSQHLRGYVVRLLGTFGREDQETVTYLLTLLTDDTIPPEVRTRAAQALGDLAPGNEAVGDRIFQYFMYLESYPFDHAQTWWSQKQLVAWAVAVTTRRYDEEISPFQTTSLVTWA